MNERLKELAMQAGLPKYMIRELCPTVIERFAELVRQDERERIKQENQRCYVESEKNTTN